MVLAGALLTGCATSQAPVPANERTMEAWRSVSDSTREIAATLARQMVGKPYVYGGESPESGFDCSGLVFYSYGRAGTPVPRTSLDQFKVARKIPLANAEPGDVVFFQDHAKLSHVGIYLGNGEFVHAPSTGRRVALARIDTPYYQEHLIAVGRLVPN